MADLAPEDNFTELAKEAEERALEAEGEATESSDETSSVEEETSAQEERPRDEQGRFVSQEEPQQEDQTDWKRNYDELRSEYNRKDQELSELRNLRDQLAQQQQLQYQQQYQQPADYSTLIDTNPAQAAQLAYQRGDTVAYQQAVQAWEELSPGAPALWGETVRLRNEMNQFLEEFEPLKGIQERQELETAFTHASQSHSDFDQVQGEMHKVLEEHPSLVASLAGEDSEKTVEAIYHMAKGRLAGQAANQNAAQTRAAESEAAVVSGGNTAPRGNDEPSFEEQEKERALASFTAEASQWADAWEGRRET